MYQAAAVHLNNRSGSGLHRPPPTHLIPNAEMMENEAEPMQGRMNCGCSIYFVGRSFYFLSFLSSHL